MLGIETKDIEPEALITAILKAPVDLLWFGGIGTYLKASTASQADAGDRANDIIRINGNAVRAKVVGEGANLGVTQAGRIETARQGILINTDALDNSAGVSTSDHEVNIKILLADAEGEEDLLDRARRFRQEQHVLIGVRILSGTLPAAQAGDAFARLAEQLNLGGAADRILTALALP